MKAKFRLIFPLAVCMCLSPVLVMAQQNGGETLPSASATDPPPPAPTQKMKLLPKLPVIEQLQQALFPSAPTPPEEPKVSSGERLVKACLNELLNLHFELTDYQKREAFKKKWEEKAKEAKTLEDADKINKAMLMELGQRFDYYKLPDAVKRDQQRMDPTFVGIGARIDMTREMEVLDGLTEETTQEEFEKLMSVSDTNRPVLTPYKDSPAAKAGLLEGDVLLKVDGTDVKGKTRAEIIKMIRGKEGSKVKLTVEGYDENGDYLEQEIEIVRQKYVAPVVHVRKLANNVTYIKLDDFMAETGAQQVLAALQEAAKVKDGKIVFDLRDNGGGRLDHAINIVSYMLAEGTIVTLRQREDYQMVKVHWSATPAALLSTQPAAWNAAQISYQAYGRVLAVPPTMPIVVLVNEHSASASELTSGALQFHKRAKIVGINTVGKGVGQVVRELPEGRSVSVTRFYFDPAGREIDFEGIRPDVEVSVEATVKQLTDWRQELRDLLKKQKEGAKQLETAADADKEQIKKDLETLAGQEKELRKKLAEWHKAWKESDPQLTAARELAVQEHDRITREEAAQKAAREEAVKQKKEQWEQERKQREEQLKKGSTAGGPPANAG
jgi:carboxyl-terminal processing protease